MKNRQLNAIEQVDQEFNQKLTELFYAKQKHCFENSQDDYQTFRQCYKPFYEKFQYLQQQLKEYPFFSQMKYNTCLQKNSHQKFCEDKTAETNKKLFDNLYYSLKNSTEKINQLS